jgi:hypothetical protein
MRVSEQPQFVPERQSLVASRQSSARQDSSTQAQRSLETEGELLGNEMYSISALEFADD